ncbi:RsiV family protein [Acinetobacter apis]|uniref:DUF3298 domain-containing protein n=1 Tax=Acinetobacter apis TaxID=1229165 RepID=A0A217ECR8_9GAMM|nr:RsiV family protein [Acinetobacter apis]SNQ28214.1 Protein of unknown function [Acinetobacter apis]
MLLTQRHISIFKPLTFLWLAYALVGCQKENTTAQDNTASAVASTVAASEHIPTVHAETLAVTLPQKIACESDECTEYDVKTIQTNVNWLNDYFLDRLKKDIPMAFTKASRPTPPHLKEEDTSKNSYSVRFLSQNNQLATFVLETDLYTAGSAHGMYHREYIVFDLAQKKRIHLADLFPTERQVDVYSALFHANKKWLEEHGIQHGHLEPTDNFYYDDKGVVFVYPLYELASYAEGMTELVLPYDQVKTLFYPQYVPQGPVKKVE